LATEKMGEFRESTITPALEFLVKLKMRKSLVFFVSDFIATDFFSADKHWAALIKKHYVVPVFIGDILEDGELPQSLLVQCQDPESLETLTLETSVLLNKYLQQRKKEQLDFFLQRGCRPFALATHDDLLQKMLLFFGKRR